MTNTQLYLAIGVPILFNTAALVAVYVLLNGRIVALESSLEARFAAVHQRFDDMRDLWRAELRRVEEVLDARLKHIEDREHP
jgi:hypothetical protein